MHLQAVIKQDLRSTWRWSILEVVDLEAVNLDLVDLEVVDLEAVDLEAVDLEAVNLEEVNLETVDLEAVDLEAVDLEAVDLEAVDLEAIDLEAADLDEVNGMRAGCWGCIRRIVNSKLWESDKVTLHLQLKWRTSWWRSIWIGKHAGSWRHIQGSTRNRENEGMTDNLRCILYSAYAALGVCRTQCMVHSVYATTRC